MSYKETIVELEVNGKRQSFSIEHATRLLNMGSSNGGWHLPADSKFRYDKEKHDIRRKSNTRDSEES